MSPLGSIDFGMNEHTGRFMQEANDLTCGILIKSTPSRNTEHGRKLSPQPTAGACRYIKVEYDSTAVRDFIWWGRATDPGDNILSSLPSFPMTKIRVEGEVLGCGPSLPLRS